MGENTMNKHLTVLLLNERKKSTMRNITEILKEIAFIKYDLNELRKLHADTTCLARDLQELYSELRIAKENSNNVLKDNAIAFEEYEELYNTNQKKLADVKKLLVLKNLELEIIKNRGLWQRIINKT